MAKGQMAIKADFSGVQDALGHIAGAVKEIQTQYYAASVTELTHAYTAKDFNHTIGAIAQSNPKGLHHVYEWGQANIGRPGAQLWSHDLAGNGNSGVRVASFHFLTSVTPIPQPRTGTAGSGINRSKRYIFAAKAAIMESGTPVTIKSSNGGMIMIPNADEARPGRDFIFVKEAEVKNPGGDVAGNFTTAWANYWNGPAQLILEEQVMPMLDKRLREIMSPRSSKSSTTVRRGTGGTRSVGLSAITFKQGMAEVKLEANRLRHRAVAMERSLNTRG